MGGWEYRWMHEWMVNRDTCTRLKYGWMEGWMD